MARSTADPTGLTPRLNLPIHQAVRLVLVRPHYPENVGAAARALKTMGFSDFALVKPSRLAVPDHEMAQKMAVKSWDVLEGSKVFATVAEACEGFGQVVATTSRRGRRVWTLRQAATEVCTWAASSQRTVVLFGNEKTGLSSEEVGACNAALRIPMAADQPSINLAQAVQLVAYELFIAALATRAVERE